MPKSDVLVQHSLSQDEAFQRIKSLLSNVRAQHSDKISDLRERWTESGGAFSLKAMGFSVKGTLAVTDSNVRVSLEFPWTARPFKGRIESAIREEAQKALKP